MNMISPCVQLNDLPDELLLFILKKLTNLQVHYSFQGVNERFKKIIHDPLFTSHLNFLKWSSNQLCSDVILDRFCLQILPEISTKIKWLDLESSSMKQILFATDYPNLYGLGLHNIREETVRCLCTDPSLSSGILKNQITKFVIEIDWNGNQWSTVENICNHIFIVFIHLTHLIFHYSSYRNIVRLIFDFPPPRFSSSTLSVLNIKVHNFDECLYILDGRFNQLQTLIIDLIKIHRPQENIENQIKIPNLKYFSLSCASKTLCYNELIPPLLYRMVNLEQLTLYLMTFVYQTFIDGNHLKTTILDRMSPQLKNFTFHICSVMFLTNEMNLPSNEDIQYTFKDDFQQTRIISSVDSFPVRNQCQCHVYSYPFLMEYYGDVTNHFPGGLYPYVRVVSLYDERPFEHEFFLQITQSFPLMQKLSLINHQAMKNDHNLAIVKYGHLNELDMQRSHDDYIEEFLSHTKTSFQNDIRLTIDFKSVRRVTHQFRRDDTRMNCAKINEVFFWENVQSDYSKSVRDYFPCAKIH